MKYSLISATGHFLVAPKSKLSREYSHHDVKPWPKPNITMLLIDQLTPRLLYYYQPWIVYVAE